MQADDYLRQGNLEAALDRLKAAVRSDPANAQLRIFLFQLLAVSGDWERAMTQLTVVSDLDAGALPMVMAYREALCCEKLRAEVFVGRRSPLILGEPQPWIALLVEALYLTAQGQFAESRKLREEAFAQAPMTAGVLNDQPFQWIADGDERLGPILEVLVSGRYYWIPFQQIASITLEAPEDLRDLVWVPVHLTWANGGQTVGLIPTRYPQSHTSGDPLIRLARKTEWVEHGGLYTGLGQRMLITGAGEFPLLDIRHVTLEPVVSQAHG